MTGPNIIDATLAQLADDGYDIFAMSQRQLEDWVRDQAGGNLPDDVAAHCALDLRDRAETLAAAAVLGIPVDGGT